MRSRLCRSCREFHDVEAPWPEACLSHFGAPANAAPSIRPDGMSDTQNMADGKVYDSKSAYYAAVKAAGCEIVGNERSYREPERKTIAPPRARDDIRRAIHELRNR